MHLNKKLEFSRVTVGKSRRRFLEHGCDGLIDLPRPGKSRTVFNAKAERINGKIQEIKTIGRGDKTFENFRFAILFFCGGLDLYPHNS